MHVCVTVLTKLEFNYSLQCEIMFFSENKYYSQLIIDLVYQGMRSNGTVSLKQESKTVSTALRASSSEISFTHLID